MSRPIPPARRFARRIFVLLAALAALGAAIVWWAVQREHPSRERPPRRPPPGALVALPPVDRSLMGTSARIVVHAPDEETGHRAIAAAFARGEEIAAICTDYDPSSELMQLSRAPLNTPVKTSPTLTTVLAHAQATAELTEGAFDPTLGPLTQLWRRSRRQKELPNPAALDEARQAAGWQYLEVDLAGQFVVMKKQGMRLDLGGIAKGFAADEMMRVLGEHGVHRAYIAIAGDIRLGAPPPGRTSWRVGLKTLSPASEEFIEVANCAVSTSGDLYQFVEIDGVRYSHIIDPSTGLGLTRRIAATVVAPTAVQSDPLATFCCIKPREALRIFQAGEISCRIVTLAADNPVPRATRQFPAVRASPAPPAPGEPPPSDL